MRTEWNEAKKALCKLLNIKALMILLVIAIPSTNVQPGTLHCLPVHSTLQLSKQNLWPSGCWSLGGPLALPVCPSELCTSFRDFIPPWKFHPYSTHRIFVFRVPFTVTRSNSKRRSIYELVHCDHYKSCCHCSVNFYVWSWYPFTSFAFNFYWNTADILYLC